jgi:menaquinone-specific isochorismate synthase
VLPRDTGLISGIERLVDDLPRRVADVNGELPLPSFREDQPDRRGWRTNIAWALDAFAATPLGKIVLARRAVFTFPQKLDALTLFARLRLATPGCFHFYFELEGGRAFLGASPERLFRRSGRQVWSEAVAGTRPRATSAADDAALGEELLLSEKDQREHEYVRQSVKEALDPLCTALHMDDQPAEMRLRRGRHLVSGLRGSLREHVGDEALLRALHPTPAVGGYPRTDAMPAIRHLEPFDRGWYAGPVGWAGRDDAEFAVGIRSGLVEGKRLSLYSGAGIVRGSNPEAEWSEIEHKISDFIKVLGIDEQDG